MSFIKSDYEKIVKKLNKIIVLGKDDFQSFYILASAYMALGDEKKSAELLKLAHNLVPEHIQIINNLASCLIATGEIDEALAYLQKGLKLDENNSQLNFNAGTICQLKQDYNNAIEFFNKAYIKDPTPATLSGLAACMAAVKRYDSAFNYYKTLSVLYPDKLNYLNNLVHCAIESDKYDDALQSLDKLLKHNPKSVELLKKKGFVLRMKEKYKESIEIFDTLIKRGKIDYEIYYNLGIAQAQLSNFESAKEALKKCVQLEPDNAVARKDLGILYIYMNLVDWAQEELKKAFELDPVDPEYAYNYAFSLFKGGSYNEADEYFQIAIKLDSKDSLFYSSYAENLIMLQKKDEAVENYKKAISLNPKNVQANFGLAKVIYSERKFGVAKELLEDLITYASGAEILNLLAMTYQNLKEYEKAAGIFKKNF